MVKRTSLTLRSDNSQKGFGFIGVLLVIAVLAIVVGGGIYAWHRDHKAKAANTATSSTKSTTTTPSTHGNSTAPSSTSSVISSADGKVQITLPATWEIIGSAGGGQVIDASSDPDCFTESDANPCVYSAYFSPKAYSSTQLWTLSVEQTSRTPQQVVESIIGEPQAADVVAQSSANINGYAAYYIEYSGPNTDIYYAVAHNGYVVLFQNGQLDAQSDPDATLSSSTSPFLADFSGIVKSVKLNF